MASQLTGTGGSDPRIRGIIGGGVFVLGAALYALMQGPLDFNFDLTPLSVGLVAICGGLLGARRRVIGTGLVLVGWGAAVLLVGRGVVEGDRTTPMYMMGIAAGLLVTAAVAPKLEQGAWLLSASVTAFVAPLGLYLTYDMASVGRWPAWAISLLLLAAWELSWSLLRPAAP